MLPNIRQYTSKNITNLPAYTSNRLCFNIKTLLSEFIVI